MDSLNAYAQLSEAGKFSAGMAEKRASGTLAADVSRVAADIAARHDLDLAAARSAMPELGAQQSTSLQR